MRRNVEQGDSVVNRRLHEFVSLEQIQDIVNGWGSIPYFMCRKKICTDAVEAYRSDRHTLAIPTLLPLAEGLPPRRSFQILGEVTQ